MHIKFYPIDLVYFVSERPPGALPWNTALGYVMHCYPMYPATRHPHPMHQKHGAQAQGCKWMKAEACIGLFPA